MIFLWILLLSHRLVSHGKYLLIETGKNETGEEGLEMTGTGCQPARINSRKQVKCGRE